MDERPTVGELFAGIGGIGLGLERAGFRVAWQVEIEPFALHVLEHRYPGIPKYGDIKAVDWTDVEPVDLLAGGFPCQPISSAGKRLAQADERWLWPEFARAIRVLRPRYVLVENVRNLLAVNGGSAFGEVLGDLAALGYDAEWDCIPASAVGAPHQRDRLWIVASRRGVSDAGGAEVRILGQWDGEQRGESGPTVTRDDGGQADVADARGQDGGSGRPGRPEHGGQGLSELGPHIAGDGSLADAARLWDGRTRVGAIGGGGTRPRGPEQDGTAGRSTIGTPADPGRRWAGGAVLRRGGTADQSVGGSGDVSDPVVGSDVERIAQPAVGAVPAGDGEAPVADAGGVRRVGRSGEQGTRWQTTEWREASDHVGDRGSARDVSDADHAGLEGHARDGEGPTGWAFEDGHAGPRRVRPWRDAAEWWAAEPNVGRVAHGVPARVDRLRALGNAVVPQVVEGIGRAILEADRVTR